MNAQTKHKKKKAPFSSPQKGSDDEFSKAQQDAEEGRSIKTKSTSRSKTSKKKKKTCKKSNSSVSSGSIPEHHAAVFLPYGSQKEAGDGIRVFGYHPADSERTRTTVPLGQSFEKEPSAEHFDSMILSLERTLFAALNNAFLLAAGGVGLMSVGNGDQGAVNIGKCILVLSILISLFALFMHNLRLHQMRTSGSFRYSQSLVWGSLVSILTLIVLCLELYFGVLYPYLRRAAAVSIVTPVGDNISDLDNL